LATYPLAIALAQFPTVTLEKVGVRRFALVAKLAYHRAGVDGQGGIVTRASLTSFCQNALPSTRAIETRLLPSSLAATHRGFAFYVAFPKRSILSRDVFYVADPVSSIRQV